MYITKDVLFCKKVGNLDYIFFIIWIGLNKIPVFFEEYKKSILHNINYSSNNSSVYFLVASAFDSYNLHYV